jgi:hypothetical protein
MKALEIDPAQRYQSATAMAGDLERTMIAARHSSRDLAKLLRGLFIEENEEPLVVVDDVAPPAPAPVPAPAAGSPTGSMASLRSSTQEISHTDRTRSSRVNVAAGPSLDGALRAEQNRLRGERLKGQARAGLVLVALAAAVAGGAKAWPHVAPFFHELLASAPPPAAPVGPPMPATMELPAPAPAPTAKPTPHKKALKKGEKGKTEVVRSGVADDVMKPSD